MEIRESDSSDLRELRTLYPAAFPEEDLLPLVSALLDEAVGTLSLVAAEDAGIAGHVVFTRCHVENGREPVALLGPLGVRPDRQKRGVGSALIRAGFRSLEQANVRRIYVLGDPAYYERFGFVPESAVAPPYALPERWRDAWRSRGFDPLVPPPAGRLVVPEPWLQRSLWVP